MATDLAPRHPNQHPVSVQKAKQAIYLQHLVTTGRHGLSCEMTGIAPNLPFHWARTSIAFSKRFEDAKTLGEKVLLAAMEEQIDSRIMVGQRDPQSAVLTMFRTKRLDPRYRDNVAVNVQINGPQALVFEVPVSLPEQSTPNNQSE